MNGVEPNIGTLTRMLVYGIFDLHLVGPGQLLYNVKGLRVSISDTSLNGSSKSKSNGVSFPVHGLMDPISYIK